MKERDRIAVMNAILAAEGCETRFELREEAENQPEAESGS